MVRAVQETGGPQSAEATARAHAPAAAPRAARDWVAWYEGLSASERRGIRDRLVLASPDEVRADPELTKFFLFHVEDLVADGDAGTRRLQEFFHVVMATRGREDLAVERRKAVAYLLAEYQHYLRDNPFAA